ncbi:hypothetical protein CWRG_00404 [Chthonomonas calidirosea]|uniref:Uncharacterized protein n=1 Tax=Chthonomonas calidirosea (strain DSM 23976 / ICMP 18418 / T49) TaxID=1303518 RepID=S0EXP6_CHTCT|nr:hypothetical protein [Chthonomonas calidirosea]CCW34568.1 hypothetical protein CCALI_00743 [Chthonomonas calidirosea T49]CEK13192.1 hypothetical protein CWRG_00404 [Chthonomonas calidirosea]CEK13195.1 hypothetical protein CP488_00409 [Chthonomonas calidirosea]CEK14411.1 hypothetical protein CTKA_00412 [Chthonomonas calidirosea]
MGYLRGVGIGTGVALGTSAVVRMRNGFPQVPTIPQRIMELLAKKRLNETPDVVLVADDLDMALTVARSLRWGRVVGIVASSPITEARATVVPAVVDIPGVVDAIPDDMLVLVDAEQGVVIADPDGAVIAQYQAEREHLAPRIRLYLDESHLPAETLDGHMVLVIAVAGSEEELTDALEAGADMLYVPLDAELLPLNTEPQEQRSALLDLTLRCAGKALLIADDYALPPMLLLEACLRADITLAEPVRDYLNGLGIGEFMEELQEAHAECLINQARCALPRLAARLSEEAIPPLEPERLAIFADKLAMYGATRILIDCPRFGGGIGSINLPFLDTFVAVATAAMLPVFVRMDRLELNEIELLLGSGVAGMVVSPAEVQSTKALLRTLTYSECRENLSELLKQNLE